MQRTISRLCVAVQQGCRPHLHTSPCVVCDAAKVTAPAGVAMTHLNTTRNFSTPVQNVSSASLDVRTNSKPVSVAKAQKTASSVASPLTSSLSLIEERRNALTEWLFRFAEHLHSGTGVETDDSNVDASSSSPLLDSITFDECYAAYMICSDDNVREELYAKLLNTLDHQCRRTPASTRDNASAASRELSLAKSQLKPTIRVPTRLVIGRSATSHCSKTTEAVAIDHNDIQKTSNAFEKHVRQFFNNDAAAVAKQLAFQEALLSMKDVLDRQGIPFFLACGTALGARRNGCFIPYDEDIDLGIFYAELSRDTAAATSALPVAKTAAHDFFSLGALQRAQDRLFRLMSALASTGTLMVFDVCGAVEKGFELRVLHTPTNTRIDLNLYYPPLPHSDDALVQVDGAFLWASSFYEAAGLRAHQMYRYRHQPFDQELTRLPFCARSPGTEGFWVPPERYLVENYGCDWQTPKQYSYTEGLAKEFKNIIPE